MGSRPKLRGAASEERTLAEPGKTPRWTEQNQVKTANRNGDAGIYLYPNPAKEHESVSDTPAISIEPNANSTPSLGLDAATRGSLAHRITYTSEGCPF